MGVGVDTSEMGTYLYLIADHGCRNGWFVGDLVDVMDEILFIILTTRVVYMMDALRRITRRQRER
ncbi:hypothetical protein BD309DRAFT_962129 [Dichomitus squalens]|nr:hypothetical protein BD309DRAFT_962129 [Dichomitus squalens]